METRTRIVTDPAEFAQLREPWDALVRSEPRPCAFLLHSWLTERIRFHDGHRSLAVITVERDGELVGALPFGVRRVLGARAAELLSGDSVSHADVLAVDRSAAGAVVRALPELPADFVMATGVLPDSHLARAPRFRFTERERAPFVDLPEGWAAAYAERVSARRRREHGRLGRRLAESGRVEFAVLRDGDAIVAALHEAFALHAARFESGIDRSDFRDASDRASHVVRARLLAADGVARFATLRVDGRLAAFGYYLVVGEVAWMYRCAFDPAMAAAQPGIQLLLHCFEEASAEGVRRVEFLGGEHAYKLVFATGSEPLLQGIGYATSVAGQAAVASMRTGVAARVAMKRHEPFRRAYTEGRKALRHLTA
jgi:CelD/BcsL family acetyltransferase involved in cellulose biosynthesis